MEPACFNHCDTARSRFKRLAIEIDAWLAAVCLLVAPSHPGLLIFAFHGLFESDEEIAHHTADPQQAVTTTMFRAFIENLRNHDYRFVSPVEIAAGLAPAGKYAMISLDDGYANNRRALPAMEEFEAPAVFSISVNHVRTGKPFWWDVLYREARRRGWSDARLDETRVSLKRLPTCDIERQIMDDFGQAAFRTVSDTDRPFTASELAAFARHPLVHIGNHTCDHAILPNYPLPQASEQIASAQNALRELTGQTPLTIAYPNGNLSPPILRAVRDAGLVLGLTGQPGRNSLASIHSGRALLLKRHTLWGSRPIGGQCRIARSPVSLQAALAAIRARASAVA